MSSISLPLSSRRMTIFSPNSVGRHETRKSMSLLDALVAEADLDAAVLRQALLGDVELRHDLDARGDRVAHLQRRRHHVVEDAVDAVADPVFLLVGLDVDVAGALGDRRHQDDVHELDDRRLLALAGQRLGADLLEVVHDLDFADVGRHLLERLGGHLEGALGGTGAIAAPPRVGRRRPPAPCRSTSRSTRNTPVSEATTGSTL